MTRSPSAALLSLNFTFNALNSLHSAHFVSIYVSRTACALHCPFHGARFTCCRYFTSPSLLLVSVLTVNTVIIPSFIRSHCIHWSETECVKRNHEWISLSWPKAGVITLVALVPCCALHYIHWISFSYIAVSLAEASNHPFIPSIISLQAFVTFIEVHFGFNIITVLGCKRIYYCSPGVSYQNTYFVTT